MGRQRGLNAPCSSQVAWGAPGQSLRSRPAGCVMVRALLGYGVSLWQAHVKKGNCTRAQQSCSSHLRHAQQARVRGE